MIKKTNSEVSSKNDDGVNKDKISKSKNIPLEHTKMGSATDASEDDNEPQNKKGTKAKSSKNTQNNTNNYMDNKHKEKAIVKPFSCNHCNYISSYKSYLENHVKYLHLRIKDYQCHQCKRTFSKKYELKKHVKKIHEYQIATRLNIGYEKEKQKCFPSNQST